MPWRVPQASHVVAQIRSMNPDYYGYVCIKSALIRPCSKGIVVISGRDRLLLLGRFPPTGRQSPLPLTHAPADGTGLSQHMKFTAHPGGVNFCTPLTSSSRQNLLLSCGKDHTVRLWQLPSSTGGTPTLVAVAQGHKDAVQAVAASPDGELCCSASWDGQLLLWDTGDEVVAAALADAAAGAEKAHKKSRKKRKVGGSDEAAATAAAAAPYQLPLLKGLEGHMHCVAAVAWPQQGSLISGGWDHSVRR
jgi:WD40 repeat protein